jgi:hypothetical protein
MNNNQDRQRALVWRDLQLLFLKRTTDDFDYALWLSRLDRSDFEKTAIIIGENHEERPKGIDCRIGVETMLHFCKNSPGYEAYLILDSDAFPVRKNWRDLLLCKMGDKKYASPVRTELLDTFASHCAIFIKAEHIHDSYPISPSEDYHNLKGDKVIELGTAMPLNREDHFPLIRTNKYNMHFLLGAIYFDMFFHHGGGSRKPVTRTCVYHDHIYDPNDLCRIEADMFDRLQTDPVGYIELLQHGNV